MPNLSQFLCLTSIISCFTHLIFKSDLACCPCAFCFRSSLTHCVIARFICGTISRIVSLRDFSAEHLTRCVVARLFVRSDLTRCVVARLFVRSVSHIVSLRDFSCGASHALCRCEIFLAERFHVVCCCEAFLA